MSTKYKFRDQENRQSLLPAGSLLLRSPMDLSAGHEYTAALPWAAYSRQIGGSLPEGQNLFGSIFGQLIDAIQNNNYNANIHNTAATSNQGSVTINYQTGENIWAYKFVGDDIYRYLTVDVVGHSMTVPIGDGTDANQEGPPTWWQNIKNYFRTNWYDTGGKTTATAGTAAWSLTLAKSIKLIRIGENANYTIFGLAETMDLIALYNHYRYGNNSPNSITLPKFLENLGIGIAGFSDYLAPAAVGYFGLEAFYPGGANGWGRNWEIHPDFSHIGEPNQDTDHN